VIDIDGQLLVDGSRVLASSYQGNLMALDVNTGRIVWGREASSYHGIERGFGNLYYVDDEGIITAVATTATTWFGRTAILNFAAFLRRAQSETTSLSPISKAMYICSRRSTDALSVERAPTAMAFARR
jgi:outer membrane protein assembly factor BamB